jgi:hypothetical protein
MALQPTKHFANGSAFVHVPTLLSASNVFAAGFAIFAVSIATIPCKAQTLFFFRILNGTHVAAFPFSVEHATVAHRLRTQVAHDIGFRYLDRRAQVV